MKSVNRMLFRTLGVIVAVVGSYVITSQALKLWTISSIPNGDVIHIVEATYGANCKDFVPRPGRANRISGGNMTSAASAACDNARTNCLFHIDVNWRIDPADGCSKDFNASWRCGDTQKIHIIFLPAEANDRKAPFICPAP